MRISKKQWLSIRDRKGVTAVEVAVTFPVLLVLVMLVFEVGRMMMVQQCLGYAAQTGSRYASLASTVNQSEVESTTRTAMAAAISNNSSVVDVSVSPAISGGIDSGTPIRVDVQVKLSDVSMVSGNLLKHLGDPTLSASAVLDRE